MVDGGSTGIFYSNGPVILQCVHRLKTDPTIRSSGLSILKVQCAIFNVADIARAHDWHIALVSWHFWQMFVFF